MGAPLDLVPNLTALVDQQGNLVGIWFRWFFALWTRIKQCVQLVAAISLSNKTAAIGSTTAYTVTQNGIYRVSWYVRVTSADGVSSSVGVTLGWREGAQTCSQAFAALTGDTVTTAGTGTITVRADSGTVLTYLTSYASNTPAKMAYRLDVTVELVS